jgi:hypothetical protein
MVVTDFALQITGEPQNYHVQLQAFGEVDSIADLRERLRPLLGNIRLTSAEVDADLQADGSYQARSLPAAPANGELSPRDELR